MSELKGQLLGIILVILVFSSISVVIAKSFTDMTDKVTHDSELMYDDAAVQLEPKTLHY